jgi:predicted nuclease with TOPRIM domain
MKGYDQIPFFSIQFTSGWFTIAPMLQDLDSLAARIGQMVQFTRQLQAERTALQAQLKSAEQERDALRTQLERREAEFASLTQQHAQHEAEVQSLRAQAEAAETAMQLEAARHQSMGESVKQQLAASQETNTRLRLVASKAREQIDSILMRLPGAAQE